MFMTKRLAVAAATIGMCFASASSHADSVSLSFTKVTNNASEDLSSQLLAIASSVAGQPDKVDIELSNDVGIASSVAQVYFDSRGASPLASGSILSQTGTSFSWGSTAPPNLPGGATLNPPFNATFSAGVNPGPPNNGINAASDSLVFRFMLDGGADFNDVMAAFSSGDLRIGLHIRSIGQTGDPSDSYVTQMNGNIIPLPSPALLGGAGLAGIISLRRRR